MSLVKDLAHEFGGIAELSRLLGINRTIIYRWEKKGDTVPPQYNAALLTLAREKGVSAERMRRYLTANVCPGCGRSMEAGAHPDMHRMRAYLERT
jgi:hypothetical protein